MSDEIPNEVLHAFANAYKFNGGTRTAGAGELKMSLPSYGQAWVTIDLMPGLRAALRALLTENAKASAPPDDRLVQPQSLGCGEP